ncbi:hypothetical protein DFH07DRAFT_830462 [Mycena maculata]|uniref:PWWP domain-containing protein n=1 Tax=Mycena maculata TaxID=230809 RepID=A0AAD7ITD9_9AGAR|nr:hypothetical protein DFH07DRAFT_830462 [Mycena maculata]
MSAKKSSSSAKKSEPETFDTREVVLGKIRGFPAWPGMVVDPASVPKAVSKERPASKKSVVYAVRFFPAGDYAWLPPKELKRLTADDISAFVSSPGRKENELLEGYRKALDPAAWEEEHAANPPAAKKRKSKSKAKKGEDGDEEDELEEAAEEEVEEEADAEEEEKAGKKRKRTGSPAPAKGKAKPKAAKTPAKNGKKSGKAKKSKAAVESEDDAGEEAEADGEEGGEEGEARASKKPKPAENASALESDPEALKVREWRHKLQKTFLSSNKSLPKEDEMPAVDTLFTTVESYQHMNIEYLTFSKIGKVMRHIHLLEAGKVPRDDEFKFRDRAKALVDKWHQILNANKEAPDGDGTTGEAADVNGAAEGDLTVMDVTMDEA